MTQMALRVEYGAHWTCLDRGSQSRRVYSTLRRLRLITCWIVTVTFTFTSRYSELGEESFDGRVESDAHPPHYGP